MSMPGRWDYSGVDEVCFSDSDQQPYRKAAAFLGDTVEDWGCGTGWAARYFTNYTGLDGSPSRFVARADVVDLTTHVSRPKVPNILCKHCLEYNDGWLQILTNIKDSFTRKFCLITCTPEATTTRIDSYEPVRNADGSTRGGETIPVMRFRRQDIRDLFPARTYRVTEETITTRHEYGQDWILYVERL